MSTPIRVLFVEDSEDDTELLLRELRQGDFDPIYQRVDTAGALRTALATRSWDIIISDYVMPHFSAPAALALLQESGLDLPFVIVSGAVGEETAVDAMKAGAHDFVMKGYLGRLVPALQRELREAAERKARRLTELALRKSEAYLRAVLDNVSDGIITIDGRQIIESLNLAAQMLFGYLPAEAIGLNFTVLLSPPYRDEYEAHFRRYLEDGESRAIGFGPRGVIGRHKDGTAFTMEVAINEMRCGGQRLFICSARVATESQMRVWRRASAHRAKASP